MKARLLIINTARFDSVVDFDVTVESVVDFDVTVVGVDGNDGDFCCLRSGVVATGGASVKCPFGARVHLALCRAILEVSCFDILEDVDFDLLVVLPGKAVDFFFFVAVGMIDLVFCCCSNEIQRAK